MATPSVLDVDELLVAIPGANPSGRSLAYDPEYDELKEARRADDDAPQGDVWQRQTKVADWDRVIELGTELLRTRTKDLQIAAWVAEAVTKRHGFAGLRDGLRLVQGIQDHFWDTYYPVVEDGDLDSRAGPFVFLNSTLPPAIHSIPLTAGMGGTHYSFLGWQEAKATDNAGLKSPEMLEARLADGKINSEIFDKEVAQTPRRFYETLAEDLREGTAAFQALDRSTDEHFGRHAPGLVAVRKALDDCRQPLAPILALKRAQEPDHSDEGGPAVEEGADAEAQGEEGGSPVDGWDDPAVAAPSRRRAAGPPRSSGGPIASVADAHQRVVEAAAYLRQNDPSSPVPFLVVRGLRMGEVYGAGPAPDPALLEPPSSEVRQALRRLASEGEWAELLEQAEQAIGRPEGRAWLDAQRYAVAAMAQTYDPDRSAAALAARGWLRAFLADFPDLADAELNDGTPTANAETRAWIRAEILPPPPAESARVEEEEEAPPPPAPIASGPPPAASTTEAPPDAWDLALAAVKAGRPAEGLQQLRAALNLATTGRDRFRRKLQMAELCLMVNNYRVALPLSEDLARQVDEFRLEEWEDEQLSARVWATLYRCLRGAGADNGSPERLQQVFTRLCRLDINQALMYGDEKSRR